MSINILSRDMEMKSSTYFLNMGFAVHACLVQMSETQRFVNPQVWDSLLHHLLFGPTLSGEERRAGETGRQEMICHPWFVTHAPSEPPRPPHTQFVIPGVR